MTPAARLRAAAALAATAGALLLVAHASPLARATQPPMFDAERLRTGAFRYDVRAGDTVVASGRLEIPAPSAGRVAFAGTFTAVACQRWESTTTRAFAPVAALLRFCKDGTDRRIFALAYAGGRVTGVAASGPPTAPVDRPVDAAVPDDTVDQRIDWAAVMALDLAPGRTFAFHVYDPGTGVTPLVGRVDGRETVTAAGTTYEAYRLVYEMRKAAGVEPYTSRVTVATPRVLLGIRFPNGTTSTLLAIE